jgi:hypothetical protein
MNCITCLQQLASRRQWMAPMNSDLRAIFIALAIFIVLFGAGIVFDYAE